jgi:hypothetical protein
MAKGFELRVRHANGVPYHRQNKQHRSNSRKHKDHMRGPHSGGGDYTSDLQSSSCPDTRVLPADGKPSRLANHRKAVLKSTPVRGSGCAASVAVDTATHETGTPETVTQDICVTIVPTSLRSSEASTIPASPYPSEASTISEQLDNSVFAVTLPHARLEEFEFEFEDVIQIDSDQCQVR